MADETDAGMEAPATGLAPESVGCSYGVVGVVGVVTARAFLALRFVLAALDRWASE